MNVTKSIKYFIKIFVEVEATFFPWFARQDTRRSDICQKNRMSLKSRMVQIKTRAGMIEEKDCHFLNYNN